MKVFLDTNVIASAIATRGLCSDVFRSVLEFHDLVVSQPLLDEVERVLRDKLRVSGSVIKDLLWLLQQDTCRGAVKPLATLHLTDQDDIPILSSAINAAAMVFVTGDKELLALKRVGPLKIISPRQFWEQIKGG